MAEVMKHLWWLSFCLQLAWIVMPGHGMDDGGIYENTLNDEDRMSEGKHKYELWKKESTKPRYGGCWREGLLMLETGCARLTRDTQHSMSLKFTNCFLEETGRKAIFNIKETSDNMLDIYSGFFMHTQNVCHFLMAQVWQEETDSTINRLADNSATVASQLANSSELQGEIILKQNLTIKNQEMLIEKGSELKQTLEDSTQGVQHMMNEFRDATLKQRDMILEVFDRVASLQDMVLGEFTGFYSLIFYTISILISYLLTSTPRTSGSRFWLFLLMTANMVMERLLVIWGVPPHIALDNAYNENTYLYERLWWCRKTFTTVGVAIWVVMAYQWKDYNRINNQLLVDIQQQNSDLKKLLQTGSPTKSVPNGVPHPFHTSAGVQYLHEKGADETDTPTPTESLKQPDYNNSTGYESGDSDCDTVSVISGVTDRTFVCDNEFSDDDDNMSCISTSSRYSREGTPSILDELRYLRESTPIREMTPDTSFLNMSFDTISMKNTKSRPKGRRSAPVLPAQPHTYNLRSRRGKSKPQNNPIIHSESAEDFGNVVNHLQQVAIRNSTKARIQMERNIKLSDPNFFSSDEDM